MSSIGPELPPHLRARANARTTTDPEIEDSESIEFGPIGPTIPAHLLPSKQEPPQISHDHYEDEEDDEDAYGPALPPDLVPNRTGPTSAATVSEKRILGPSFPGHDRHTGGASDDSDDDDFGPKPMTGHQDDARDGVREFMEKEERRRKEVEEAAKPKVLKRDEWMLVPPSSNDILGKLSDPTKLKARQFSRSTAQTSRSAPNNLWTETPAERQQRIEDEVSGKKRRAANADPDAVDTGDAETKRKKRRDEEIRKVVDSHTRASRGQTLLDMHAASSASSSASKPGTLNDKDEANIIWDHSRDMSLGGRLMDDKQRNKLITEARGLGDRFGTGKTGGYL